MIGPLKGNPVPNSHLANHDVGMNDFPGWNGISWSFIRYHAPEPTEICAEKPAQPPHMIVAIRSKTVPYLKYKVWQQWATLTSSLRRAVEDHHGDTKELEEILSLCISL